ncbi:MAG: preprotein translocase subunit SecY [Patescibacteria group bacterium]|nr:preprotein translocase subunit SecY [Patescibacteria group bacterium]
MEKIIRQIKFIFSDKNLRNKIYFTLIVFFIFRIFSFLPVPAINLEKLRILFSNNQFLSLLDIFSGGTLINFSVMALGLNPYINASIIFQLMTILFPQLEQLAKEGEYGKYKINQYTRILTLPLTIIQAIGIYVFLRNQNIINNLNFIEFLSFVLTISAGTFILVWFGELISEYGLGNGISLLILSGIVGRLPVVFSKTITIINQEMFFNILFFLILSLFVISGVVFINEAIRKIPIFYAKRIKGNKMYQAANTYLPLKLNQAGVIPIIFAVSFVLFPQIVGNFFVNFKNQIIVSIGKFLVNFFSPTGFFYNFIYFFLVVGFTYFYTIIVFNPQKISEEIQKNGGFIPGIRPGTATKEFLNNVVYKITSVGALFLGLIAILPVIMSKITGINNLIIGGTGILIVVSVILETFKMIEAQLVMKNYDKFIK